MGGFGMKAFSCIVVIYYSAYRVVNMNGAITTDAQIQDFRC